MGKMWPPTLAKRLTFVNAWITTYRRAEMGVLPTFLMNMFFSVNKNIQIPIRNPISTYTLLWQFEKKIFSPTKITYTEKGTIRSMRLETHRNMNTPTHSNTHTHITYTAIHHKPHKPPLRQQKEHQKKTITMATVNNQTHCELFCFNGEERLFTLYKS